MSDQRLSKNQKDALFILALLETKRATKPVPVSAIRRMISQSRASDVDASNFRKGVRLLASRGFILLARRADLALVTELTRPGRYHAAKVYSERTGQDMDLPPERDEQITIFDQ